MLVFVKWIFCRTSGFHIRFTEEAAQLLCRIEPLSVEAADGIDREEHWNVLARVFVFECCPVQIQTGNGGWLAFNVNLDVHRQSIGCAGTMNVTTIRLNLEHILKVTVAEGVRRESDSGMNHAAISDVFQFRACAEIHSRDERNNAEQVFHTWRIAFNVISSLQKVT